MDSEDVRSGIAKSWAFLDALGLGESFVTPTPLSVDAEFRSVALNQKSLYTSVYEAGLMKSHYNILLWDLAYLQFSWSATNDVRYAYYPNPFISGNKESQVNLQRWRDYQAEGILSEDEVANLIESLTSVATIPLIRYENAPSQYRAFQHPCSHMHIGLHSENRWPIARILTPLAFSMWIAKQYYGENWHAFADDSHPLGNALEQDLIDEQSNCRILGDGFFSTDEARSVHMR